MDTASGSEWKLPAIPQARFAAFRAMWAALLLAAILATAAAPFLFASERREVQQPFFELGLRQWDGRKLQTPHAAQLRDAGMVAGTELIAVEGRPVPADATMPEVAHRLAAVPGKRVKVTLRSPAGKVATYSIRRSLGYMEASYKGSGLSYMGRLVLDLGFAGFSNLVLIATAVLLFWRRPRDGLAALLSTSLLLWAASENLSFYTWMRLDLVEASGAVSSFAFALMIVGLLLFPDGRFSPRWARWVAGALGLVWLHMNSNLVGIHLPAPAVFLPMLAVDAAALAAIVLRYRRTPAGTAEKQQEKWLALGLAGGTLWLLATILIQQLPAFLPDRPYLIIWSYVGSGLTSSAVTLSIAAGLLIALLRYRLYDAEAAISRSATLALLTLAFAAVFAGSAKALEVAFESELGGDAGSLPGIVAAILATLVVTPAQSRIQDWTADRFQKALAHLRKDLPDCVDDLRETADLEPLVEEILRRLETGVRSARSMFVLGGAPIAVRGLAGDEARAWLERNRPGDALPACDSSDPLFPLRLRLAVAHTRAEAYGLICLGPRPDGSLPGRDEREALSQVIDPIARAVRVVLLRHERERRSAERIDSLGAALERLAGRIARLERRSDLKAPGPAPADG